MKNLRPSLLFVIVPACLALIPPVKGQTPAPAAPPAQLGSTVFAWESLKANPTDVGERRNVADLPTATLVRLESHITTLNPGLLSHPPHTHANEEIVVLRDGTLEAIANGKSQSVSPGSLIFFASNEPHGVHNPGDKPATYFVFAFETAATHAIAAGTAAADANPARLRSTVFTWEKLAVKPTDTGERRNVFSQPTATLANLECHVTTLNPGMAPHPAHAHPDEEILYVTEGQVETTFNGRTQIAGKDAIIFFAANDVHGFRNVGTTPATYYVIRLITDKTPAPAAPKAGERGAGSAGM
jgi:quercetin dioxygenase-like cupin family protein